MAETVMLSPGKHCRADRRMMMFHVEQSEHEEKTLHIHSCEHIASLLLTSVL